MKCLRCANEDPFFIGKDGSIFYCRKCIAFGRLNIGEAPARVPTKKRKIRVEPMLEYELTDSQKQASQKALSSLQKGKDCFVYAATGAGKTEMSFASITYYLSQGKKVGFAISRRQVVLEIAHRLSKAFPTLHVIEVCEGHTSVLDGDIIVCTTHQLYRYPQTFDLLILDELDAFPYAGNEVLEQIARNACIGQRLLLSATPDPSFWKEVEEGSMELVSLFERPHKHPLPVPTLILLPPALQIAAAIIFCLAMKKQHKQVLLFVPRISDTTWMKWILRPFCSCNAVHSKEENKDAIMEAFRQKEFQVLISTTLLERGITVPSVQVVVIKADHIVFTTASLIQIYGRAGRSFSDPSGKAWCLCSKPTEAIKECRAQICRMNADASAVLHQNR